MPAGRPLKLTPEQVTEIRVRKNGKGETLVDIALSMKLSYVTVFNAYHGKGAYANLDKAAA